MSESRDPTGKAQFSDLVALMARLRGPQGCPWDRAQDHRSLRPCLLEEAYEVLEAVDRDDPQALCQELGDLLLQVLFHAQLAAEAGRFDIGDAVQALHDKLVARHPHVFGEESLDSPDQVLSRWDELKRQERGESAAPPAAAPRALPALARAQQLLRRSGWAPAGPEALAASLARLAEARGGREAEEAVGELLLAAAVAAQAAGVNAEQALRERVDRLEEEVGSQGGGARAGPPPEPR